MRDVIGMDSVEHTTLPYLTLPTTIRVNAITVFMYLFLLPIGDARFHWDG